jgi:OmcA/MtrC family decaheme c-type cytochrome
VKSTLVRVGLLALMIGTLASCGGGGGGGGTASDSTNNTTNTIAGDPVVPAGAVAEGVKAASFTNGVSNASPLVNPKMAFQLVGPSPLTVNDPPVVNFAVVDASGKHVPNLKLLGGNAECRGSNVTFAIAKYDGANWQNLISLQRLAANTADKFSVIEGTTDPKPTATITNPATALTDPTTRVVGMLEESAANSYYTYRFAMDVSKTLLMADAVDKKNVSLGKVANNGNLAIKDGTTIHRIALQLCYVDPVTKATVKVNPYMDFTLGADGKATPLKDSLGALTDAKKVVDRASCNECHKTFAQHGGNRVDPNYCVMCHNPGSKDYNTNNEIDFKLMVHKFHMGKRLTNDYQVVEAIAKKTDPVTGAITGVIYPQNQKNCVKCHDGSATAKSKTAQGDNWKNKASKNACFACHDNYKAAGSNWRLAHSSFSLVGFYPTDPDASQDFTCVGCHSSAGMASAEAVHAIPQWTLGENYQYNILTVTLNPATATAKRTVTVRYSVSNPKDGSEYDLLASNAAVDFSGLSLLLSFNTADYNSVPINVRAVDGKPVGTSRQFELTSELPDVATGTGVVAFQGRVTLDNASALKLMPAMPSRESSASSFTVPVKNALSYFAITDTSPTPRRVVVSADKCNSCHGKFVGFSDPDTTLPGWGAHDGDRNDPQVCVICHNGNAVLLDGTAAHFKSFIHELHKEQAGNFPVWPLTKSSSTGAMAGLYTGIKNCTVCHEGDSYKSDKGVQVSVGLAVPPSDNGVISPKASACYSCHTTPGAKDHMISVGGAQFGTVTQANLNPVQEVCNDCHQPAGVSPVDKKHAQ